MGSAYEVAVGPAAIAERLRNPRPSLRDEVATDQRSSPDAVVESGSCRSIAMSSSDVGLKAYFTEAAGWDSDRIAQVQRGSRIAWRAAAAATLCAVAASIALTMLLPLKSVEPFVIRVDNTTGIVDVVPVYSGHSPLDQTVTRYFLAHYVSVCERFNFITAESDYEECGSFHNAQRNQAWYALWNPSNPRSPLNVHKDGSAVDVQVAAVSFFQRSSGSTDTAQVRYIKAERAAPGAQPRATHWIATIQYLYGAASMDPKSRRWNPLGFKVTAFISEPEIIRDDVQASQ
jgi:type IV secretion system protein VirB8